MHQGPTATKRPKNLARIALPAPQLSVVCCDPGVRFQGFRFAGETRSGQTFFGPAPAASPGSRPRSAIRKFRVAISNAIRTMIVPAIAAAALVMAPLDAAAKGDPERGAVIAYTCTGCHGIPFYKNVYPTYTVPKLGGQNQEYLISALQAYRSGSRKHPTMQAQSATLSDQDILDITAYFVSFEENES
jgi:cytochrome c553